MQMYTHTYTHTYMYNTHTQFALGILSGRDEEDEARFQPTSKLSGDRMFSHACPRSELSRAVSAPAPCKKVTPRRAQAAARHSLARDRWRWKAVSARAPLKEQLPAEPSWCRTPTGRRLCLATSARRRRTSAPRRNTDTPMPYSWQAWTACRDANIELLSRATHSYPPPERSGNARVLPLTQEPANMEVD